MKPKEKKNTTEEEERAICQGGVMSLGIGDIFSMGEQEQKNDYSQ